MPGEASSIKVYCRLRPSNNYAEDEIEVLADENVLRIRMEDDEQNTYINNKRTAYKFKFANIFEPTSKQDYVYESTARQCVDDVIKGFNATIFAYGQTGSGKTYTMTGGSGDYSERGIIPRCLAEVFERLKKKTDSISDVWVTYLQVYNGVGYDLLGVSPDDLGRHASVESLPRFKVLEDGEHNKHIRGLSAHNVTTLKDALYKLFDGDTNRSVAATAMNEASSRSHCIFTVTVRQRQPGSDTTIRSKLNLVDLAGSERVSRTHAEGEILNEAKYINGSLFSLERVITALHAVQQGDKTVHVPYRSSLITTLLQDSLGGNSRTVMLATVSGEPSDMLETISTCRFAHRVMMIKNSAVVNEETSLKKLVDREKAENRRLRRQIAVEMGLQADDGEEALAQPEAKPVDMNANSDLAKELELLRQNEARIAQLDQEIAILADMLTEAQAKGGLGDTGEQADRTPMPARVVSARIMSEGDVSAPATARELGPTRDSAREVASRGDSAYQSERGGSPIAQGLSRRDVLVQTAASITAVDVAALPPAILSDPKALYNLFTEHYPLWTSFKARREGHRGKIKAIKGLAQQVPVMRAELEAFRAQLEERKDSVAEKAFIGAKMEYSDIIKRMTAMKEEIEAEQAWFAGAEQKAKSEFRRWVEIIKELMGG
ncbi:kinesin-like protein KIF6 [Carpediemonas membranifera]|uniref:Kinesin-like protein n=1 Tax=Carpediemonas membranifera TaxID=201153 RepID=A0A8J6B6M8_9EUKA|nr:kinesin-like protein KIF6 [Carpediemonas membranifera]|eukprot:KAG9391092.1 kinesin-like protein KIF6 [Carpediemonas membranifera]